MLGDDANLPKSFLRLRTKSQTSDFPTTLAKRFFDNLLVDHKEVAFYHRHCEFLRVRGRNPPLSANPASVQQSCLRLRLEDFEKRIPGRNSMLGEQGLPQAFGLFEIQNDLI